MPTVSALHTAKATRLPMRAVDVVEVEAGSGIVGDRYHGTRHRHVTVQSQDALDEASRLHGSVVEPALTRRNLTVSDGVVPREPGARIRIGDVLLEVAQLLPQLEKRGLIVRRGDGKDKRVLRLFLTPQGKEITEKAMAIQTSLIDLVMESTSEERCLMVADHMEKIVGILLEQDATDE